MAITPFAYGPVGNYLVATDTHEVFVCNAQGQDTQWTYPTKSQIVGVGNTAKGILVLDRDGRLKRLNPRTGEQIDEVVCQTWCRGLTSTPDGRWAASHVDSVTVGSGAQIQRRIDLRGVRCVALDDGQGGIAVATREAIEVFLPKLNQHFKKSLPGATGLAWSNLGWWLVTTPYKIYAYTPDLSRRDTLASIYETELSGGVVSPTGRIIAFRMGENAVGLVGLEVGLFGIVEYAGRKVGELQFGPHPYLGIGIGLGDGNRISLTEEIIERSDPPPDRQRNRWLVVTNIEYDKVAAELQSKNEYVIKSSTGSGCLGATLVAAGFLLSAALLWWGG